jgi:hypothetical protein
MDLFKSLLYIHIILGSIALLAGTVVMIIKKGDKNHKRLGSLFYWSMFTSALISLVLSWMHQSLFLAMVAIFTIQSILTGKRYLKIKSKDSYTSMDKGYAVFFVLSNILLISYGIYNIINVNNFGIVMIVFGGFGFMSLREDYIYYISDDISVKGSTAKHLQRMVGGYIASFTAFIVVNNHFLPDILAWLSPTFIFAPFAYVWSKKLLKK